MLQSPPEGTTDILYTTALPCLGMNVVQNRAHAMQIKVEKCCTVHIAIQWRSAGITDYNYTRLLDLELNKRLPRLPGSFSLPIESIEDGTEFHSNVKPSGSSTTMGAQSSKSASKSQRNFFVRWALNFSALLRRVPSIPGPLANWKKSYEQMSQRE